MTQPAPVSGITYNIARFRATEMMNARAELRALREGARNLEEVAQRTTSFFYERFVGPDGAPAFALTRFFKTHRYDDLDEDLKKYGDKLMGGAPAAHWMRCLVLLATRGDEPAWNQPSTSIAHRVIPLPSEQIVLQAPMVSQLIQQLGMRLSDVIRPGRDLLIDSSETKFNVFHVEEAEGSPVIPAQEEFVRRYGIRSVLGFGSSLATGDMFAVVLFSRTPISKETAEFFKPLTLVVKIAVVSMLHKTFAER